VIILRAGKDEVLGQEPLGRGPALGAIGVERRALMSVSDMRSTEADN
jgi:hypothetical protein